MIRFSANLGFLWTDRSLPEAIRAAKAAGFHAVECHWPFLTPPSDVAEALSETDLPLISLNTSRGDISKGFMGLSAVSHVEVQARDAISQALDYAAVVGAKAVHVMAGKAHGPAARDTFLTNLEYATDRARSLGMDILIEPMNRIDLPDYFLKTCAQGRGLIEDLGASNLKVMFDCYHVARTESDVIGQLREVLDVVGHIQFSAVPDRGPPDGGLLDYKRLFAEIDALGWDQPLGAEYKPGPDTDAGLGWMQTLTAKD